MVRRQETYIPHESASSMKKCKRFKVSMISVIIFTEAQKVMQVCFRCVFRRFKNEHSVRFIEMATSINTYHSF